MCGFFAQLNFSNREKFDQKKYIQINKEYKDLKAIMDQSEVYFSLVANICAAS